MGCGWSEGGRERQEKEMKGGGGGTEEGSVRGKQGVRYYAEYQYFSEYLM